MVYYIMKLLPRNKVTKGYYITSDQSVYSSNLSHKFTINITNKVSK
jgi:hypothetical protein